MDWMRATKSICRSAQSYERFAAPGRAANRLGGPSLDEGGHGDIGRGEAGHREGDHRSGGQ
jgi:hypothetical protein